MTTLIMERQTPKLPFGLFIVLAMLIMTGTFVFNSLTHAANKHPIDHDEVRQCLASGGATWWMGWNKSLSRWAFLCQLPDGRIGTRIIGFNKSSGSWYQATSFVIDEATTISDGVKYLEFTGYTRAKTLMEFSGSPLEIYARLIEQNIIIP